MNIRTKITIGDAVLIFVFLTLAAALFVLLPGRLLSGDSGLVILQDDRVAGRYSLNEDRVIEVQGPLGTTTVRIEHGHAWVESSACQNKICVHSGKIGLEGGCIVCVPNRVIVTVGKEVTDNVDAVSR